MARGGRGGGGGGMEIGDKENMLRPLFEMKSL